MTDRELLQQALDALKHLCLHSAAIKGYDGEQVQTAIDVLKARLAPFEPEPITMVVSETGDPSVTMSWWHEPALPVGTPLYTAPPQRKWVELTDEEIKACAKGGRSIGISFHDAIQKAEAKLKEKNT